jgi:hypothetical protein
MRTPPLQSRGEALHRRVNCVDRDLNMHIPILPLDTSPLISNSWLAGFIDADRYFYIKYSESKNSIS